MASASGVMRVWSTRRTVVNEVRRSGAATGGLAVVDARVNVGIGDVGDQVRAEDADGHDQADRLNHWEITLEDRVNGPAADARDRKNALGNDRTAKQQP